MCLIVFAWKAHSRHRLVLGANRDEYLRRPTQALGHWDDAPAVAGGRDIEKGGSWLAASANGRWAAVTNFRDGRPLETRTLSRGHLVRDFVVSACTAAEYVETVAASITQYPGCNLLVGDTDELFWVSNRHADEPRTRIEPIAPGIHGLSNHLLDTPWPKVARAKQALHRLITEDDADLPEHLFSLLADREPARDEELPRTGISTELERVLSPPFIVSEGYGTRASTIMIMDADGRLNMHERSFGAGGKETDRRALSLEMETGSCP